MARLISRSAVKRTDECACRTLIPTFDHLSYADLCFEWAATAFRKRGWYRQARMKRDAHRSRLESNTELSRSLPT